MRDPKQLPHRREFLHLAAGVALLPAVSRTALAQTTPTARNWFVMLGTAGGPNPRSGRAQFSNLLTVNGTHYIIDAGDGVARRLAEAGINARDVGTIFITHGHDDHTAGLVTLMSVAWDQNRVTPINIYGPPGTEALVKAAVQYLTQNAEIRISDGGRTVPIDKVLFGHDVGTGMVYQDTNVKITAVENTHYHFPQSSPAFGKYKSYSYRFENPDRVIVFTGDTGPSDAVTDLARGADILVSEITSVEDAKEGQIRTGRWQAMSAAEQAEFIRHMSEEHLTPDQVGIMATRAGVKTVILSHFTLRPRGDDYSSWAEEVKKHFAGHVVLAKDLMEF
jgi:ribonuclease BN (tRNA processing enzyme)